MPIFLLSTELFSGNIVKLSNPDNVLQMQPDTSHGIVKLALIVIIIVSSIFNAAGQSGLETINSFRGHWSCINGEYLYGTGDGNRTTVFRKSLNSQTIERRGNVTSVNVTFQTQNRIYTTSIEDLIFVLVKDTADVYSLLRSADGGLTFTISFTFGENNGTDGRHAPDVRLLRGFLELNRDLPSGGGKGTLILGEYNIGQSRVRGSTNDRLRIMKSEDNGLTWSKVIFWNTNGQNQIGHIHAIKQDPYTGYIYICTGDSNEKSGIIKWDGRSGWTDNSTLSQIRNMQGFDVFYGQQRYRACDVLFDENYFYTFTDTQLPNNRTGSESGIWRGNKDFSQFTRMNNDIFEYDPMHVGWFGEKIGNTFVFTTAREYEGPQNAWREINTHVYTSDNGINWTKSGLINWRDTGSETAIAYPTNMFYHNNRIYIDCMGGAGHNSTIVCELTEKQQNISEPVVLHPVFFVGNWNSPGNNSNTGTSPDYPKRTLHGMFSANTISAGSRIRISEGDFNEQPVNVMWANAFIQGKGPVFIEGRGSELTKLIWTGNHNSYAINAETSGTRSDPLIFKDINFQMTYVTGSGDLNNVMRINGSSIRIISCKIEGSQNIGSSTIRLDSPGSKFISDNSIIINAGRLAGTSDIFEINSSGTQVQLTNSIILNGWNSFNLSYPETMLSLTHCTFYNIGGTAIILERAVNSQPFIKNCIFSCGINSIEDRSGLTETDIDYNYYHKAPAINISDGGHSITSNEDPRFANPAELNFELLEGSPCIMKGTNLPGVPYDYKWITRRNPTSIGAVESFASPQIPTSQVYPVKDSIKIYPNPAIDRFSIDYMNNNYNSVRLINSSGVMLFKKEAEPPLQHFDISLLKPGVYFIELSHGSTIERIRIVKK